jgi:hypothetical protein
LNIVDIRIIGEVDPYDDETSLIDEYSIRKEGGNLELHQI